MLRFSQFLHQIIVTWSTKVIPTSCCHRVNPGQLSQTTRLQPFSFYMVSHEWKKPSACILITTLDSVECESVKGPSHDGTLNGTCSELVPEWTLEETAQLFQCTCKKVKKTCQQFLTISKKASFKETTATFLHWQNPQLHFCIVHGFISHSVTIILFSCPKPPVNFMPY